MPRLPTEVRPLIDNLNGLLDQNDAMIQRAPTAGRESGACVEDVSCSSSDRSRPTCGQGSKRRDHRSIATSFAVRSTTSLRAPARPHRGREAMRRPGPTIESVVAAIRRLPDNRLLEFGIDVPGPDVMVACGPEDLEEVLGNLIDNAAKWARTQVLISVTILERSLIIRIEDDGPGMPADMHERAFRPGERLDETAHPVRDWVLP